MKDYVANFNFNGSGREKRTSFKSQEPKKTQTSNEVKSRINVSTRSKKAVSLFAVGASFQIANTVVGTEGLRTGNYAKQRENQITLSLASRGASIITGFAFGLVSGLLAVAGNAVDLATKSYKRTLEIQRDNDVASYNTYLQGFSYDNSR